MFLGSVSGVTRKDGKYYVRFYAEPFDHHPEICFTLECGPAQVDRLLETPSEYADYAIVAVISSLEKCELALSDVGSGYDAEGNEMSFEIDELCESYDYIARGRCLDISFIGKPSWEP